MNSTSSPMGPRIVAATATLLSSSTVQVEIRYEEGRESEGLLAISTPNCTTINGGFSAGPCCAFGDGDRVTGLFFAQLDGPGNSAVTPTAVLSPTRRSLSANVTLATAPSPGQNLIVRVAWSQYPGCVLYNSHLLPALPSIHNLIIRGGVQPPTVLRLHNMFSSNMVLQRTIPGGVGTRMWGQGVVGSTVTVTVQSHPAVSATVDSDGNWEVTLPSKDATIASEIVVSDGTTTLTLSNVAWGDVYFCSGQSNMQIALSWTFGGAAAIANASSYTNIRLFSIPMMASSVPLYQSKPHWLLTGLGVAITDDSVIRRGRPLELLRWYVLVHGTSDLRRHQCGQILQ